MSRYSRIKIVQGCYGSTVMGRVRASFVMLFHLWSGHCHLLTTRPSYEVKAWCEQRGDKDLMIFEVEIK